MQIFVTCGLKEGAGTSVSALGPPAPPVQGAVAAPAPDPCVLQRLLQMLSPTAVRTGFLPLWGLSLALPVYVS